MKNILKYRLMEEVGDNGDAGGEGAATSGDTGGDPNPAGNQTWPDNWRETYAGDDEKKLNAMSRYTSPTAAFDGLLAAQSKIRTDGLKTPFPVDGKDEDKAAWREANGIPDAPDKYDLTFDDGLVIGEKDKPIIDGFTQLAFDSNIPPEQVKGVVQWYYAEQQRQAEEREALDDTAARETSDALHAEWGADYRRNINSIDGLLSTAPSEVKEGLSAARMPDGTPVMSDPGVLQYLAGLALQINPATTLIPNAGGDIAGSIEDEIKAIEDTMKTDRKKYNDDNKMQERYRQLLDAREKMAKAS